jgi:transporter family-2 protein
MIGTHWPHFVAVAIGAGLTFQIGMNAAFGRALGSPLFGALANFTIGLVVLVACVLLTGLRYVPGSAAQVPAWAWFGGLFGAAYVAASTVLGPRIGAMALLGLVLVGQIGSSLLVDHYGLVGFPRVAVTPQRVLGAVLLLVGTLLVLRR